MTQVFSNNVSVSTNETVPFNNVVIDKGNSVKFIGNTFQFNKAGIYFMDVTANVTPAEAGEVSLQLVQDGLALPYAVGQATGTVGNTVNIKFSTLVRCAQDNTCCCTSAPTRVVLNNIGENISGDFNVVVTKIC